MNAYPYRGKRRADPLRKQILGVLVRAAEQNRPIKPLKLTEPRRRFLEAVEAGAVKWYPTSAEWRAGGRGRSHLVRESVAAGWTVETFDGDRRSIALTEDGRKALGLDEPA